MKIEDFENATSEQLRAKANECFEQAANWNNQPYQLHFLNLARFYLDERDRRENDRVARRDFRMELIVIALIALELVAAFGLAWWGGRQQAKEVQAQLDALHSVQAILSNLQDSSKATADTLVQLKVVTDSMNAATQGQLAVSYDPSVLVKFTPLQKLDVLNNGRTNITLWGSRIGTNRPYFLKVPSVLPPNGGYEFEAEELYKQLQKIFEEKGSISIPYEVYVKNELGEKFVIDCTLTAVSGNLGVTVATQINAISRREWRKN